MLHRAFFNGPNWKDKKIVIIDHHADQIADRLKKFWPGQVFNKNNLIPLQGTIEDGLKSLSSL